MDPAKILIIEGDPSERSQVESALGGQYHVSRAGDCESALMEFEARPCQVVVLGLAAAGEGKDAWPGLIAGILEHDPLAKVIVTAGEDGRDAAVKALSIGAHEFITKPVRADELKAALKRALYVRSLESREAKGRDANGREQGQAEEIIGTSPKIQEILYTVRKVASTDVPVLITGESGTGKELVARAIHMGSFRRTKPFIPINCGAIPESLLESELFGHEKGAFTGAHAQRAGRIEMAQGGTLFLDEIAEMPAGLQVKMLRFLQNFRIERVGGSELLEIDARVIAATNRVVKKLIIDEKFREDLFYRLAVVSIEMPPLRERGDDAMLLVRAFLQKHAERTGQKYLSLEAIEAIKAYEWPGNVRELENRIRRAITFSEGQVIRPADLGFGPREMSMQPLDLKKAKEDLEMRFAHLAIIKHKGNISKAANELGLSRPTLHHIIKKYKLRK